MYQETQHNQIQMKTQLQHSSSGSFTPHHPYDKTTTVQKYLEGPWQPPEGHMTQRKYKQSRQVPIVAGGKVDSPPLF